MPSVLGSPTMDLTFPQGGNAAWEAQLTALNAGAVARRVRSALHIPYVLTPQQKTKFKSLVKCDVVFEDRVEHTHPFLRALHYFADCTAFRHGEGLLDIGGDPRKNKVRPNHVCMLVDNARDELRAMRANLDPRADVGTRCYHGAQHCRIQAPRGASIHSAYDISWETWYAIFEAHDLQQVDIWILEPEELFGGSTDPIYGISTHRIGSNFVMLMDDGTAGYEHSAFEWQKYRNGSGYVGPQFNLAILPEGQWGILRRYVLFRSYRPLRVWSAHRAVDRTVAVVPLFSGGVAQVPLQHWDNLLSWGLARGDDKFSFQSMMAYARALRHRLVVGSNVIHGGWQQDAVQQHDTVQTAFVVCAALRYTRTQTLSAALKRLKHEQTRGWFGELVDRLKEWLGIPAIQLRKFLTGDLHRLRAGHDAAQPILRSLHGRAGWNAFAEEELVTPPPTPGDEPRPDHSAELTAYRTALQSQTCVDGVYAEIAQNTLDFMDAAEVHKTPKRTLITGPPGSGKSTRFSTWSNERKRQTLVVVPTRKQKADWHARGFAAYTPQRALQACAGWPIVVVDECTLIHPGCVEALCRYSGATQVYCVGDLEQIAFCDFEGLGVEFDLKRFYSSWEKEELNVTHRCPKDATKVLARYYNNLTTTSTRDTSICRGVCNPAAQHLCFTQGTKQLLLSSHPEALTVHEAQGSTFRAVCLHVEAADETIVRTSRPHCIVALSRHTGSLVVCENGTTAFSEWLDPAACVAELSEGLDLAHVEIPLDSKAQLAPENNDGNSVPPNTGANMDDLGETFGADPGFERITSAVLAEPQRPFTIQTDSHPTLDVSKLTLSAVSAPACRFSRPQDKAAAVTAVLSRITCTNKNPDHRTAKARGAAMHRAFQQWIDSPIEAMGEDESFLRLAEALRAAAEKDPELKRLMAEEDLGTIVKVENHLKQQSKYAGEPLRKVKAGQGINAWSKKANMAIGPFVRAAQELLLRHLKSNVMMVVHQSDAEVQSWIKQMHTGASCVCNDFTEFDSTQNESTLHFECLVFGQLGVPPSIVSTYRALRASAKVNAQGLVADAAYARMSGEANTLFGNTIVTMAVNALLCPGNFDWAAFKGDDSIICNPSNRADVEVISLQTGMQCKLEEPLVAEFVGFLITGDGVYPDWKRKVGKLSGRGYPSDPMARDQFAQSVKDSLGLVPSGLVEASILANAVAHSVTPAEAQIWYDILSACCEKLPPPQRVEAVECRLDEEI
nr:ORF1 [Bat Middle East Hepe-Astrovirus]